MSRNQPMPLDTAVLQGWLEPHLNPAAIATQGLAIAHSRRIAGENRTAWLLRAIAHIDLTTLAGDDTPAWVRQLCAKALQPLPGAVLQQLTISPHPEASNAKPWQIHTAAVCVYHPFVATAVEALQGKLPVAAVSTGFPAGLAPLESKLAEIRASRAAGAAEIDVVITRAHVLLQDWQALYDEICAFREACGDGVMKVILATGELGSYRAIYQASMVAMLAGADFIKTSTGKESINATLPVSLVMLRAIAHYQQQTGCVVGFKPAGGIRSAEDALHWLVLVKEVLGDTWLSPKRFRFGASSLLGNIVASLTNTTHAISQDDY